MKQSFMDPPVLAVCGETHQDELWQYGLMGAYSHLVFLPELGDPYPSRWFLYILHGYIKIPSEGTHFEPEVKSATNES